ncbi:NAD-dependent epimerase/dehydratase family protein [Pseudomonas putida CSV86]|uniref:NAD-dependent epimerase/dehydratase family protein n=1 Tax=Pseudomonas bharatica CSV86 TaxID=1005395 RepID=A0A7K4E9P4_9PSED|nr:NAD-dependent epimerase/dehydratase family protein [Pseudomonas bharatica CSV86]
MNVSMTGGSGFIGKLLCKALVSRGDVVTLLSRKGGLSKTSRSWSGI